MARKKDFTPPAAPAVEKFRERVQRTFGLPVSRSATPEASAVAEVPVFDAIARSLARIAEALESIANTQAATSGPFTRPPG